ncbi:type II toxin-antitoxin system death-on-curing family toxin [Photobacterium sp. WH77]|uniref:type II toxin-antitoxin system death-on-curing family toxin n=1 Tax=unclassified Photobacterium TaxID=2628852 RepID=UPI001EDB83B9|nr:MULTISPECIES: type II toxin-antitoxin system death-on-curing family toxin [unclassified Photobacterium]MCG2837936.1 type II toxin-antitoxin system death-on-curing family toxin [Photobacterium sp. WH77]MCG2845554.1 type II toxin-antitoxin system death-on-curing family toxin [Photobacterium sp. WH80]
MSGLLFLEAEDILEIHDFILSTEPGVQGVHIHKLEAVAGRVKNISTYEGISTAFELAAHYAVAIARGHAFVDGNKRTAFVAMIAVLEANGFPVPEQEKIISALSRSDSWTEMMVKVAEGKIDAQSFGNSLAIIYTISALGVGIYKIAEWFGRDK